VKTSIWGSQIEDRSQVELSFVQTPHHAYLQRFLDACNVKFVRKLNKRACWVLFNKLIFNIIIIIETCLPLSVRNWVIESCVCLPTELTTWVHHVLRVYMSSCLVSIWKFHLQRDYRSKCARTGVCANLNFDQFILQSVVSDVHTRLSISKCYWIL